MKVQIDKKKFEVLQLDDLRKNDSVWKSKTVNQRIAAIEMLRQINYGYNPATERLQRTITVTQLKKN